MELREKRRERKFGRKGRRERERGGSGRGGGEEKGKEKERGIIERHGDREIES